jgi:hypothetical protein
MDRCCQYVKANIGYTQNDEWYAVMSSNDKINCECHLSRDFCFQNPSEQWKDCEKIFFRDANASVEWNIDIHQIFLDKTCKTIFGKLKKN